MNILVTGGLGFIGSNFINHLFFTKNDYTIHNVDCFSYAANIDNIDDVVQRSSRYSLYECDISNRSKLESYINDNKITHIINFAAESHVDNSIADSTPFITTNINGVHNLLEIVKCSDTIERFVQISTDEVYGSLSKNQPGFTEQHNISPNSPYSASKASADLLCKCYYETYKCPVMITRCSNNYGPNQHKEKLIPLMIHNAINNIPLPVYGDGTNIRDWIHVSDHCRAIDIVLHDGSPGEVYNVGGECELTNIEIVRYILRKTNRNESLLHFVDDRLGHDFRYAINCDKFKRAYNWQPTHDFFSTLDTLIENAV